MLHTLSRAVVIMRQVSGPVPQNGKPDRCYQSGLAVAAARRSCRSRWSMPPRINALYPRRTRSSLRTSVRVRTGPYSHQRNSARYRRSPGFALPSRNPTSRRDTCRELHLTRRLRRWIRFPHAEAAKHGEPPPAGPWASPRRIRSLWEGHSKPMESSRG